MEMTLQELMEEIRLTEKKIAGMVPTFKMFSALAGTERAAIGYDTTLSGAKFDKELAKTRVRADYQSYRDLVKRLGRLKEIRDEANMRTQICIAGEETTIYRALLYKRVLKDYLNHLFTAVEEGIRRAETTQNKTLGDRSTAGKVGVPGDPDLQLTVLVDHEKYVKDKTQHEEMLAKIDAAITVANVKTIVKIG